MIKFDLDIDGIIYLFDKGFNEALIDFDDEDIRKGYVCNDDMLYLFTISDLIGGTVHLFFDEIPSINKKKIAKAFKVPFEVKSGEVVIRGYDETEVFNIENGLYEIHFYIYKEVDEQFQYDLYFIKSTNPKYKILIKEKTEKLDVVKLINSKENTMEEAFRYFNFNFKLPTYFPVKSKFNNSSIYWQKFFFSDGSTQGIIKKEFSNPKDNSYFNFSISNGLLNNDTKKMKKMIILEHEVFI